MELDASFSASHDCLLWRCVSVTVLDRDITLSLVNSRPLRWLSADRRRRACARPRVTENDVNIALSIKPSANVVQIYGICVDAPDGRIRIVMEHCGHGSLRSHLQSLQPDKVSCASAVHFLRPFAQSAPVVAELLTELNVKTTETSTQSRVSA